MCESGETEEIITFDGKSISVDACLHDMVQELNNRGIRTLACCCGHEVYPPTIVCIVDGEIIDAISRTVIQDYYRTGTAKHKHLNFYKTDDDGMMYLPEVAEWEGEE